MSNQANMSHPTFNHHHHHCTPVHQTVCVLTFNASHWNEAHIPPLTETAGTTLCGSPDSPFGVLGVYHSKSLAERVGEDWAGRQLDNFLDDCNPALETEEERQEARSHWCAGVDPRDDGVWQYSICDEQCDELVVEVSERRVVGRVEGCEDGEEDEDDDADDEGGEEEGQEGGEEKEGGDGGG